MKKILSIAVLLISLSVSAQGNLQFNEAKNLSFSATINAWVATGVGTITVPTGKVWKVEHSSVWYTWSGGRRTIADRPSLYIGNIMVVAANANGTVNQFESSLSTWLPAGTYNIVISNESSSNRAITATINAIEFNVVP